jgi:GNAT superfamily N-acetyltransferase
MPITFDAPAKLPFDVLTTTFNRGYEGYVVPIQLNESQLRGHIMQHDIDLGASRVAFDVDTPVGIAFMGRRGTTAWIGGIGVAPEYRGQGIGRQLMLEVIDAGRRGGVRDVQLEVIQGNERAYQLYLSLGFALTRQLLILQRAPAALEIYPMYEIESVPAEKALTYYEHFHTEPNPWQRQLPSLHHSAPTLAGRVAKADGEVLAYAVGYVSERGITLTDVAAAQDEYEGLRSILIQLHQEQPDAVGRIVNLPEADPALPILSSLGYHETMRQHEMVLRAA